MEIIPQTKYAKTDDGVYLAYQVVGEGPIDLVWQLEYISSVDSEWQRPLTGAFYRSLAGFSRLILHDRRGVGLSSRNVSPPNLETRVADLEVVLAAVGSERPVLGAFGENGAPNVLFAAAHPERVRSIVWEIPSARSTWTSDYPWGYKPEDVAADQQVLELWGTAEYGRAFQAQQASRGNVFSDAEAASMAKATGHACTPDMAMEIARMWYQTDVRGVLPLVEVPTLILVHGDSDLNVAEAEYIAGLMPQALLKKMPGRAGEFEVADVQMWTEAMRSFIGAKRPLVSLDRVLAAVLFTDIVGSTEKQASLGDRGWKDLVERHHAIVRSALTTWRGIENDTAGDGFYVTFDGPARAIRCALEITERVRELGVEIRAGIHTGECEVIDGKVGGLAVSIGARVAANAGPSEVLVSQTVRDLVAGSGLTFEDRGEHELKGVPDRWHLYRVVSERT